MMEYLEGNIAAPGSTIFGRLLFEHGQIQGFHSFGAPREGADWILPGFIDLHIHGIGEFSADTADGAEKMAEFAPSAGITSIVPTLAPCEFSSQLEFVSGVCPLVDSRLPGAKIPGSHLEGPFIDPLHKGGMNEKYLRKPSTKDALEILEAAAGTLRIMTISPELPGAKEVIPMLVDAGVTVSAGHTGCSVRQFRDAVDSGITQVCHLFDTFEPRLVSDGISRLSLADAAMIEDRVMLELIMDGFHVPEGLLQLARRAAGIGRLIAISDAMQGAGLPDAEWTGADGLTYRTNSKEVARESDGTIVGSCLTANKAFGNMVTHFGFQPWEASRALSANPAKALGIDGDTGEFKLGKSADIAVLQYENFAVKTCLVNGRQVFSAV